MSCVKLPSHSPNNASIWLPAGPSGPRRPCVRGTHLRRFCKVSTRAIEVPVEEDGYLAIATRVSFPVLYINIYSMLRLNCFKFDSYFNFGRDRLRLSWGPWRRRILTSTFSVGHIGWQNLRQTEPMPGIIACSGRMFSS